ncbi:ATPase [Nostoc sp. CENA543]|uniref:AAA family ATPase n=1 Tax=Nostoc sp. CENA543 TaxID=1869241 RepID=UPI000CA2A61C|nr:ATP-binding protein [Nostoc sp. CENA543]AUS98990.1 ATPase [Nostoc sp. CENA543]
MLKNVRLNNYKSHKNTQLNFDNSRLHGLVGKNSAGKTSVLQALYNLCKLANSEFSQIFKKDQSPSFITTIGEENMSVLASGFWTQEESQYSWGVLYTFSKENYGGWLPSLAWKIDEKEITGEGWEHFSGWDNSLIKSPRLIHDYLNYAVYLKLVAGNLGKAAYSDEITPKVETDGSFLLAPTLDFLRDEAPEKFELIEEKLSRIVPNVRRIGIRRAKVPVSRQRFIQADGKRIFYEETQEMTGQEVILDMNTGERIPAHAISEGTILTLGLLTVLMNPSQPNLVLLDDVEQGLHPKAQRELMTVFKEIIADNPNLQIIFSTHSPYIVDELVPSQVHILNNSNSGFTVAKRLDEHPDVEWAKQTLTTGEFWDAEGEEWVVEGEVSD